VLGRDRESVEGHSLTGQTDKRRLRPVITVARPHSGREAVLSLRLLPGKETRRQQRKRCRNWCERKMAGV